jgi:LytS/YehU family sensor histidine kinase
MCYLPEEVIGGVHSRHAAGRAAALLCMISIIALGLKKPKKAE